MRWIVGFALSLATLAIVAAPASAAKPRLSVADVSVDESEGAAKVTISGSKRAKRKVSVRFATRDRSARAGSDYGSASGTVRIAKRKRSASVEVPIIADAFAEPDEELTIELSAPRRARLADGTGIVRIVDDDGGGGGEDPRPTVSLITTTVPEGTAGNPVRSILVGLSAPSAETVAVDYATVDGTAASPGDFAATSGTLTFAPGATSRSFDLTTVGDFDDEPDETVLVNFSDPVNVELPGSQQSVTIADDDDACISPDSPPGLILGNVNGDADTAPHQLVRSSSISPCGDTDWFSFGLTETSDSQIDLHARAVLTSTANGSPSAGDIDVCVQKSGVPASETCSEETAGITEVIDICVDDPLAPGDQSTNFLVEVDGFGNAVNNYDLEITGNVAFTTPDLNLGC